MNQIIYFPSLSSKNSATITIRSAAAVIVHIGTGSTRMFAVFLEAQTIWSTDLLQWVPLLVPFAQLHLSPFLSFFLPFIPSVFNSTYFPSFIICLSFIHSISFTSLYFYPSFISPPLVSSLFFILFQPHPLYPLIRQ